MKDHKKSFFLCAVLLSVCLPLSGCSEGETSSRPETDGQSQTASAASAAEPVENKEQALEIAHAYVLENCKSTFEGYQVTALQEGDEWIVSYSLSEDTAGGGPQLRIRASDGKVVSFALQR
ncbi:hypothetical protein [Candidatus Soleaferrea massiliensis]|uniref:hypothetical protein n=1 Tax=Candidatus Soleaferrea massiliensis TaxID=1470354 RepID=UPI00058D0E5D|nr:hypothetical protein [Candidatus Soleaferrea massiliensis]